MAGYSSTSTVERFRSNGRAHNSFGTMTVDETFGQVTLGLLHSEGLDADLASTMGRES